MTRKTEETEKEERKTGRRWNDGLLLESLFLSSPSCSRPVSFDAGHRTDQEAYKKQRPRRGRNVKKRHGAGEIKTAKQCRRHQWKKF